jgi:hypothetical protein
MFTPGGQVDHLTFAGVRGGGKGGGGQQQAPSKPQVYTDPVNGMSFTDDVGYSYGPQADGSMGYTLGPTQTGSDKLNAEINQRKAQEKSDSDAAKAASDTKAATAETTFQGTRDKAYNDALTSTIASFQRAGVDPNAYMDSYIKPMLDRQKNSIQDLDPNPYAAFPTTLGDTILNSATGDRRTTALNTLNSTFAPTYSSTVLPDDTTGKYVSDIVNEQFDPLMQQLTNAQKRGTLTDVGYNSALASLNQKKDAATSTVGNLGRGILSSDRSALDDFISGARSDVNNLTLGGAFDPSTYTTRASGMVNTDLSDFGGALRNAVGGSKFADITDLISAGGAAQGANNPTAANPAGAVGGTSSAFVAPDEEEQRKRGLGNQGAF